MRGTGKFFILIAACLYCFYAANRSVLHREGWWTMDYSVWTNNVALNSRTKIKKQNGQDIHLNINHFEIIKPSELEGWFVGGAISLSIMLIYWDTFFYPIINLY